MNYNFEKDLEIAITLFLASKRCPKCQSKYSKNCSYDIKIMQSSASQYRIEKILYNSTLNHPIKSIQNFPFLDNGDWRTPVFVRNSIILNKAESKYNMATIQFNCQNCFYLHTINKVI